MSDIAVEVNHLWKKFHRGEFHDSLRDLVPALAKRLVGRGPRRDELAEGDFWALRDVSFQVKRGEVLGIIGPNGAGKSTLLKILSKIIKPNRGSIRVNGRLRALIEVAAGFHQDLTGRENVYLNGAILGMKKREIDRKFDEIVDFSGIEEFLDTPVKRYSSGMHARLGFAVAAHLDPEVLIVDEVLSVGDAEFQQKCVGKMQDVAGGGRTVLFVSHNMGAVQNLCTRATLLDHGDIAATGCTADVVRAYLSRGELASGGFVDLSRHRNRWSGRKPLLRAVRFLDTDGNLKNTFCAGEPLRVELTVEPLVALRPASFGIGFDNQLGIRVFSVATYLSSSQSIAVTEQCRVTCDIDEICLAPGRYYLSLSAGQRNDGLIDAIERAASIEVEAGDYFGNGKTP